MGDTTTVSKWGNSQGVRLPKAFCEQLDIAVGDKVSVSLEEGRIIIASQDERHTLKSRMRNWDGKRQDVPEVDWGKPVGREMW